MKGWVYIISNKAMPGLVKVGFSTKDPELRAAELNNTGAPHPYVVDYEVLVDNPREVEQKAHKSLKNKGLHEGKEFFKCSVGTAVTHIRAITGHGAHLENSINEDALKELERKRREEEHRSRLAEINRKAVAENNRKKAAQEYAAIADIKREEQAKRARTIETNREIRQLSHQSQKLNDNWENENSANLKKINELKEIYKESCANLNDLICAHNLKEKLRLLGIYFGVYGSIFLLNIFLGDSLDKTLDEMMGPFIFITSILLTYIAYRIIKKKEYISIDNLKRRMVTLENKLEVDISNIGLTRKPTELPDIEERLAKLKHL